MTLVAEVRTTVTRRSVVPGRPVPVVFTGAGVADLTVRERQILELVTNGYSNLEIARQLHLSLNTIKTHVRVSYRKIGARTRSHAVVWGARHGLLVGFDPAGVGPDDGPRSSPEEGPDPLR